MRVYPAVFLALTLGSMLFAQTSPAPAPATNVPIVIAVAPQFHGSNQSLMSSAQWEPADEPIDFSQIVAQTLQNGLKHVPSLTVIQSVPDFERLVPKDRSLKEEKSWIEQLDKIAQQLSADEVLVIQSGILPNFIVPSGSELAGNGVFKKGNWQQSYAILVMRRYSRSEHKFIATFRSFLTRDLGLLPWHDKWSDYTDSEKQIVISSLRAVTHDNVTHLFHQLGMMRTVITPDTKAEELLVEAETGSKATIGRNMMIPTGLSTPRVHEAVLAGYLRTDWKIIENSPTRIVGINTRRHDEYRETTTFQDDDIQIVPEHFKLLADGKRESGPPNIDWHVNLRDNIEEVFKSIGTAFVPDTKAEESSVEAQPASKDNIDRNLTLPTGLSAQEAHEAVLAAYLSRDWKIIEDSPTRIVGSITRRDDDYREITTFKANRIEIIPEHFQLANGKRESAAPNIGWHENLRASLDLFFKNIGAPSAQ